MNHSHAETLRFTLGLKLRSLRREKGLALSDLAERAGLAVSYLSEIEKGKKFPKPEKLLDLAGALGVAYDDLVSQRVDRRFDAVRTAFDSEWLREFPFHLFGLETEDVFGLVTRDPDRAGAFLRTFLEIGRMYDLHVEQFLLAALRSYQQMNGNSFADLEEEAARFRREEDLPALPPPGPRVLARILRERFGYALDEHALGAGGDLGGLRSVFAPGPPPRLYVNPRLLPSQKAFVLAREIGFRRLGLEARPATSSWLRVDSFDEVLNNFRASYFAGALLVDRDRFAEDVAKIFARPHFKAEEALRLLARWRTTPETLLHRLTEVLPARLGVAEIFFLRFTQPAGEDGPRLTKVYNLSRAPVPHGMGLAETYCRRWPAIRLLTPRGKGRRDGVLVDLSRLRFLDDGAEFLVLTTSRPLRLNPAARSTVALGLLADERLGAIVRFADDPAVPRLDVNLTCERCGLEHCRERGAPPLLHRARLDHDRRERAVAALLASLAPPATD